MPEPTSSIVVVGERSAAIAAEVASLTGRAVTDLSKDSSASAQIIEVRERRAALAALAGAPDTVVALQHHHLTDEPVAMSIRLLGRVYLLGVPPGVGDDPGVRIRIDGRPDHAVANEIVDDATARGAVAVDPRTEGRRGGFVAVAVLAAVLVVFVTAGIVAVFALRSAPIANQGPGPQADFPAAAPIGDEFVPVIAGPDGSDVAELLRDRVRVEGRDIVPGSETLIATATSRYSAIQIVEWDATGSDETETCTGHLSDSMVTTACGFLPNEPNVAVNGTFEDGVASQFVTLSNASDDAAWIVVTTHLLHRVVAPVQRGVSFAEWSTVDGRMVDLKILDADQTEIWHREFEGV
ncbi:MAG: hypothetical protein ACR2P0_04465 [Acidimicrobiales bacterium]